MASWQCCSGVTKCGASLPPPLPPLLLVHSPDFPTCSPLSQLINFYFEFLSRETFLQAGLLLMPGSSTFLLAQLGAWLSAAG